MTSDNLDKLAPALVAAIAEMPALEMDGRNPYYKSRYTTLGAVIAATRDILARHGLAITQQVTSDPTGEAVGITTVILHESGQLMSWEAVVKIPLESNPGQEAGKLITYLRRYSLAAALNLYSDEDIDANSPQQQQGKRSPQVSNNGKPANITTLTIEQAGKVTDSKGTPYLEIPSERLRYMVGSISKAIKANGHDLEKLATLEDKQAAAKAILRARAEGSISEP